MSLTCDVTGSTDRVEYLPKYMQTETVKKVCFRVAVKMEQERIEKLRGEISDVAIDAAKEVIEEIAASNPVEKQEPIPEKEEVVEPVKSPKKKKSKK